MVQESPLERDKIPAGNFPSLSRMYADVRCSQLEGTYPGSEVAPCFATSALRVAKGWGAPEEVEWPDDHDHWPPPEPPGIDALAKKHRVLTYERACTIDHCLTFLAANASIGLTIDIDKSWHNAPDGLVAMPWNHPVSGPSHAVAVIDVDLEAERLIFVNSWGPNWGDRGVGYLPYEYFEQRVLDAWAITDLDHRVPLPRYPAGIVTQWWSVPDPLGGSLYGIEVCDRSADEMIGWGFAVERDEFLDVQELFVRPAWRNKRYGSTIARGFKKIAQQLRRLPRAWIPHADMDPTNRAALNAVLRRLSLTLERVPIRSVGAVATCVFRDTD